MGSYNSVSVARTLFHVSMPVIGHGIASVDIVESEKGTILAEAYLSSSNSPHCEHGIFRVIAVDLNSNTCPGNYFLRLGRAVKDSGKLYRNAYEVQYKLTQLMSMGEDIIAEKKDQVDKGMDVHSELTEDYIVFQEFSQFLKQL